MKLRFTKMQGAGNDFVVIDGVRQALALSPAQVRWLADRHFGIGADQVLLVEPAHTPIQPLVEHLLLAPQARSAALLQRWQGVWLSEVLG